MGSCGYASSLALSFFLVCSLFLSHYCFEEMVANQMDNCLTGTEALDEICVTAEHRVHGQQEQQVCCAQSAGKTSVLDPEQ